MYYPDKKIAKMRPERLLRRIPRYNDQFAAWLDAVIRLANGETDIQMPPLYENLGGARGVFEALAKLAISEWNAPTTLRVKKEILRSREEIFFVAVQWAEYEKKAGRSACPISPLSPEGNPRRVDLCFS